MTRSAAIAAGVRSRCRKRGAGFALSALPLLGCEGAQAALAARGPHADAIADLAWLLFGGGAVIFAAVLIAAGIAAFGASRLRAVLADDRTVLVAGAAVPIAALTAVLVHGLRIEARLGSPAAPALAIEVVGERWWWRVHYLDATERLDFATANEIHIPVGRPVELRLATADVIHSFWVPSLAGKLDMIPGRVNRMRIQADRAGTFRGQCAEYCGGAHALMALHVVAAEPAAFEAWREAQRRPSPPPATEATRRGRDVYVANGCPACHRIAGTPSLGSVGPDLSHVGGRLRLVAGMLPNHAGAFAGWIASAQHVKPESRMPSFDRIGGTDLVALAAYLEALQ
jgi:cytochrome c oxidase subunit 2